MRLSIITPTRNAARWLPQCLESVRLQEGEAGSVEHIVLDGQSSDGSASIARELGANVIEMEHTGVYRKINVGNQRAAGDVIGYLAGDDFYLPGTIRAVRNWYERGRRPWFVGGALWMDANGRSRGALIPPPSWIKSEMHASLGWNCIFICSVFLRRDFLDELGGYDESFICSGDYEFHARALSQATFDRTPHSLSAWRMHANNLSRSGNPVIRDELARIQNAFAPKSAAVRNAYRLLLKIWLNGRSPRWFLHKKLAAARQPPPESVPARSSGSASATS